MTSYRRGGFALAGIALSFASLMAHADGQPGVLWETTSKMVMAGMPMGPPPNTVKLCAAQEWTSPPPPPPGQSCTQSNFQRSGNKVSWDTQCTGQMEMSGHGEITFDSADSYTGAITFNAEGTNMTINLTGKKIGECDNPL